MILEVVENQLRDNDPPETRQTVERLMAEGYSAEESRRLIGIAVSVEIYHVMRDREVFNLNRYLWNLALLPQEPWDNDGKELYTD
jgi:hypothetical protein